MQSSVRPVPRVRTWIAPSVAAVLAAALDFAWITKSDFVTDDFRNLAEARRSGLTLSFLLRPIFEHFAPGHRFLDWLVINVLGRDQRWAALVLVVFIAGSVWALWDLLNTCFGVRPVHVVLAWLLGTSWVLVGTGQWFAAGAHSIPALFLTILAADLYARWRVGDNNRFRWLSVAATVGALLFWPQALLIPLYLLLMDVFVFDKVWPLTRKKLVEVGRSLAVFVAIAVAYVTYVNLHPWHTKFVGPSLTQTVHFLETVPFRGFLPTVIGAGLPNGPATSHEKLMQAAAVTLVVVAAAVGIARHYAVLRAVGFFGLAVLGVAATVLVSRLAVNGPRIGNEPRFLTPLPFLFFFAVGLALTRPRSSTPPRPVRPRLSQGMRVVVCALGVVALAGYLFNLNATTDRRTVSIDFGAAAHITAVHIDTGVGDARERGLLHAFVNIMMPPWIWYPFVVSEDGKLSHLGPYFDDGLAPIGEGDHLLTIDNRGVVRTATFLPFGRSSAPSATCSSRRCLVTSGAHDQSDPPVLEYVRVVIDATGSGTLLVVPSAPGLDSDVATSRVSYTAGHHQYVLPTWSTDAVEVRVTSDRHGLIVQAELGIVTAGQPIDGR